MIKKFIDHQNELDFIRLLRIIWDGKVKLILITTISILIGVYYIQKIPETFENSIIVEKIKMSEFIKLKPLLENLDYFETNNLKFAELNKSLLKMFSKELMDYEELISVLKNNEKIKKKLNQLSKDDQKQLLFNYAQKLNIIEPKKKDEHLTVKFNWDNDIESRELIIQTLQLTIDNLHKNLFTALEDLFDAKVLTLITKDLERIVYLEEQSAIAKELNIDENSVESINLSTNSNIFNTFSMKKGQLATYLRGYKAIDKEIGIIRNRTYSNLNLFKDEINKLKQRPIKWVNYNIYALETKPLKNSLKYLVISIVLGLGIGLLYVIISNLLRDSNFIKKKTN